MLIAQLTDIHLGSDPKDPAGSNRLRLDRVLDRICALRPRPDLLLATGDLADKGDVESYRKLFDAFARLPFPVHCGVGNHDDRVGFSEVFREKPMADGFVQYVVESSPVCLIMLDTLEAGRHGGAFCAAREAWLRARLADNRTRPTMIVLHHPPIDTGIAWLATNPKADWVRRLRAAVEGADNIVGFVSGHLHRAIAGVWEGRPLIVAPPVSAVVDLDLSSIDPERPDGRPMVVAGPPGFALHWWNGAELVSHFDYADDRPAIARYDGVMQPLVRKVAAEWDEDEGGG